MEDGAFLHEVGKIQTLWWGRGGGSQKDIVGVDLIVQSRKVGKRVK